MKKILKIAAYDFKRIMFNPITLVGLIIVLSICLVTGFVLKPQTTPVYSASISGETTREIYQNFIGTKDIDSQKNLDKILNQAKDYLNIQDECFDKQDLRNINETFQNIKDEIKKFTATGDCIFLSDLSPVTKAVTHLKSFVDRFATLKGLDSALIFTNEQFTNINTIAQTFNSIVFSESTNAEILNELHKNIDKIDLLNKIATEIYAWECDQEILDSLQKDCLTKAQTKLNNISNEMKNLHDSVTVGDIKFVDKMLSLATNYKLTCESAKMVIETKFKLLLEKKFERLENLYHFDKITIEDSQLALTKATYFINDESLYYTDYQTALNFNTASYQISIYDYTYMITSIVGLLTILFGIFITYKLFGRDRKNGKMDTVLAQDISFNQVFFGKTLAILLITSTVLVSFMLLSLLWGMLIYATLPNPILAVFNLSNVYTIHPFLFLIIKVIGIELQTIFYSTITLFLMNISRKFDMMFGISIAIFAVATILNIFLNGSLVYCLFPFIHADITSFLGGATMQTGFLKTALYASGNFFISISYYLVVVLLLYNFTKQLFKKN